MAYAQAYRGGVRRRTGVFPAAERSTTNGKPPIARVLHEIYPSGQGIYLAPTRGMNFETGLGERGRCWVLARRAGTALPEENDLTDESLYGVKNVDWKFRRLAIQKEIK